MLCFYRVIATSISLRNYAISKVGLDIVQNPFLEDIKGAFPDLGPNGLPSQKIKTTKKIINVGWDYSHPMMGTWWSRS